MNRRRPFLALWGWPISLGVLSASGLGTALVSDTWGDWWSWLGLGAPVAVMAWCSWPHAPASSVPGPAAGSAAAPSSAGSAAAPSPAGDRDTGQPPASR